MTIPAVLYMSLRTGLLVERPSHEGWTSGDVQQWEADHERFAGQDEVDAAIDEAIEEAGKELRAENANLLSQVDQLMRENESLRQQVPRSFSLGPKNPFDFVQEQRAAALMAEAKRQDLYGTVDLKDWPGSRR